MNRSIIAKIVAMSAAAVFVAVVGVRAALCCAGAAAKGCAQ